MKIRKKESLGLDIANIPPDLAQDLEQVRQMINHAVDGIKGIRRAKGDFSDCAERKDIRTGIEWTVNGVVKRAK